MSKNFINTSKIITYTIYFIIILLFTVLMKKVFHHFHSKMNESFINNLANPGLYPLSEDKPLLNEFYPLTRYNNVTNNNSSDVWWYYPSFKVNSFKQITNNIKYPNNPDNGTCSRSEFCGTLYKDKQVKTNIQTALPPVPCGTGARVNYYRSKYNLLI